MPKNKQSNLIANVKMPSIDFMNKCIINSGIRGGGYSVLVTGNYQSLLSNVFPLVPFFFAKYRRNTLLRVCYIE